MRALADDLNGALKLPKSLGLRYAECGEANAFYDPETRTISLCFELIEQLAEDFGRHLDDDDELATAVAGAYIFIALHEVGHALVDVLELPITGREEDAVDQLSAWLLIGEADGNDAVLTPRWRSRSRAKAMSWRTAISPTAIRSTSSATSTWCAGSTAATPRRSKAWRNKPACRRGAEACAEEYARIDTSLLSRRCYIKE